MINYRATLFVAFLLATNVIFQGLAGAVSYGTIRDIDGAYLEGYGLTDG